MWIGSNGSGYGPVRGCYEHGTESSVSIKGGGFVDKSNNFRLLKNDPVPCSKVRGPFEKYVDSPYYSESELCGGTVMVSFSK